MMNFSRFGSMYFYPGLLITLFICFGLFTIRLTVHAQTTPVAIGTISTPTFDCTNAVNTGGIGSQTVFNTSGQVLVGGACSSLSE